MVHIMISPSRGFIIQILDGFISVNQQMEASDMERKSWLDMQPCEAFLIFLKILRRLAISQLQSLKQDNTMTLKIKVGTT